jgi:para-nitrobenzyl esterase
MGDPTSGLSRRSFGIALVSGTAGALSPRTSRADSLIATTTQGRVRGTLDEGIHVFKGIPYGADTGGANRWLPAKPPTPWSGIRDALEHPPAAMQPTGERVPVVSEDCLGLNVWTPALADGGKRPVMVWLHGGGFSSLSGSSPMYDGVNLCNRGDVVVLTLNHRLNVFGFLHLADMAAGHEASGNVGMLDLITALSWVRDNIAEFGGDPDNVTIFGESGGGRKVSTLLAMPEAQGLFHRAIIQSGPGIHLQPRDKAHEMALALLRELGVEPGDIGALKSLPAERILAARAVVEGALEQERRAKGHYEQRGFVPTVGVSDLPDYAFNPTAPEISSRVPVMIGSNRHEMALWSPTQPELYDRTLGASALADRVRFVTGSAADRVLEIYADQYPDNHPAVQWMLMISDRTYRFDSITLAQRKALQGAAPVFMYYFTWESLADPKLLAHHALEIPFAFDNAIRMTPFTGGGATAATLADKMSDAWIAFARSGDPNTGRLPKWMPYDIDRRTTMVFDNECHSREDPDQAVRRLWATV